MLATSPLFCYPDWPRRFFGRFPGFLKAVLPFTSADLQPSSSCVYSEVRTTDAEPQQTRETPPATRRASKLRLKHKLAAVFTVVYILEQLFMPYSHFITRVRLQSTPKSKHTSIFFCELLSFWRNCL